MRDLELPIGTAFDPVPEPMAYLSENCITYCNPAFSRAFPGLGPGSSLPEDWQELTGSAAALLRGNGRDWTALTWPFQGGILLRLTPVESQPLLPNHRLGLLSQKLRDPISGLMSAGESLDRLITPFQEAEARQSLSRLNKANLRLLRLGRNLELAALPEGKLPYDFAPQPVDLNGLCRKAARQLEMPVEAAGCSLVFTDWKESLCTQCDDDLVLILIYHLVSNALRAAGKGGHLELRLERRGRRAFISLLDDGPGMTAEQLADAFAPDRGGDTLAEARQGLGLGLTVCRNIARLHEGALLLANREERGLCATFSVPLCRPSSAPQINSPRRINSTNGVPLVLRELSDVLPERCFSPKDL